MIDSHFRGPLQSVFVDPMVGRMKRLRWEPHVLTAAALVLGVSVIPALMLGRRFLAAGALLLSGYLDAVDGSFARATNRISDRGAALDIICDRAVEFSVILGLYLERPESRAFLCILMLGSALLCVTSFLVVGIFEKNSSHKSFHYSPGLMERAEAFIFFEGMILAPGAFPWLAAAFTALVLLTAAVRTREFCRQ